MAREVGDGWRPWTAVPRIAAGAISVPVVVVGFVALGAAVIVIRSLRDVARGTWARVPAWRTRAGEAGADVGRAARIGGRRFPYLGRTVGFPGRIDWDPAGLSEAWRVALNGLDELVPLGVAAALAPSPDARRRWYDVACALVREWNAGTERARGAGWSVPAPARRIPHLL